MVLRRLEGDGVQKTVQRLEDGMDSPGFEYRQAKKKGFFSSPKRPDRLSFSVQRRSFPGVKRLEREFNRSLQSNGELWVSVNNTELYSALIHA